MGFKVTEAVGSNSETYSEIDILSDLDVKKSVKEEIKQEVGEFLVEQILLSVADRKSPIAGGSYKATLSRDYAKLKKKEVGNTSANLELTGAMLDSVKFKKTDDGIQIGVFGKEAGKADGHNNLSGDSPLPQRQFLPKEGEKFKANIQNQIDKIIADKIVDSESFKKSDFSGVDSKSELYDILDDRFPDLSKPEIKAAVLRNGDLLDLLDELDLLELL